MFRYYNRILIMGLISLLMNTLLLGSVIDAKGEDEWKARGADRKEQPIIQAELPSITVWTSDCAYAASMKFKCHDWDTTYYSYYYKTPYSYAIINIYGKLHHDIYVIKPSQYTDANGKVYTYYSGSQRQCAPSLGICSNWASIPSNGIVNYVNTPRNTPIMVESWYYYTRGSGSSQQWFLVIHKFYLPYGHA